MAAASSIPEFGEQHLPIASKHLENMRRLKLFNQVKLFCKDEFDLVEVPNTDDANEIGDMNNDDGELSDSG